MFQSRRKANSYRDSAILLFLVGILVALLLAIVISPLVFFFVLAVFSFLTIPFYEKRTTWIAGAEGEEKVAEHLSLLDDEYYVIHDVVLPEMTGNIDHIVLGLNGIFVIETKNHNGLITCYGDSWTRHKIGRRGTGYRGRIGNPSKQVKRKAVLLGQFIKDRFGIDLFINGIVVFSNEEARLKINNPTVAVLKPRELYNFIQSYRSTSKNIKLVELEATLKPYSCFS